jgi:hypothetical protein
MMVWQGGVNIFHLMKVKMSLTKKTGFSWGGVVNVFLRIWKSSF